MPFFDSGIARSGRFTEIRLLEQGASGQVYYAFDTLLNLPVAVKEVLPTEQDFQKTLEKFRRESQIHARLRHTNIISIYDLKEDTDTGAYYLVCEYANAGSLAEYLHTHCPLDVRLALEIALDICAALEHIGSNDIVHCDVKPANILLVRDSHGGLTAKLGDFGIAQDQQVRATTALPGAHHPGTPPYMAPEQWDVTTRLDIRTDIYALGITLFEMVTGQDYKTVNAPAVGVTTQQPTSTLCHGLNQVISKAVREDRTERYQTPENMADDVQSVLHDDHLSSKDIAVKPQAAASTAADEHMSPTRPLGRHLIVLVGLFVVGSVVIGIIAFMLTSRPPQSQTWPTYREGDKGMNVWTLQMLLRAGNYDLPRRGSFDPRTTTAVQKFQRDTGLDPTGVVDSQTWERLVTSSRLQNTSNADAVIALQIYLNLNDVTSPPPNGTFDDATVQAVRQFQADHRLPPTGIPDVATWHMLIAGLSSSSKTIIDEECGLVMQIPGYAAVTCGRIERQTEGIQARVVTLCLGSTRLVSCNITMDDVQLSADGQVMQETRGTPRDSAAYHIVLDPWCGDAASHQWYVETKGIVVRFPDGTVPAPHSFRLGPREASCMIPSYAASVEGSPLASPGPVATPTGIRKFVGMDCKQHGYSFGQERTVIEVCAWANLDYDNHRLRGRATVKHISGPTTLLAIPAVHLKQNGQIVRSSSKELIAQEQPALESYTELLNCGEGGPVTTEVLVVVTYQDGQQREYTHTSTELNPRC